MKSKANVIFSTQITPGGEEIDYFYNYDEFVIEKISVLIENKKLYVDQKIIEDIDSFKNQNNHRNNQENSNIIKNYEKNYEDLDYNISSICTIKNLDNSIFIEIPKSILDSKDNTILFKNSSQTPVVNKFKKRVRDSSPSSSLDKDDLFNDLDKYQEYNNRLIKTACETNKKSNSKIKLEDTSTIALSKKLNMGKVSDSREVKKFN